VSCSPLVAALPQVDDSETVQFAGLTDAVTGVQVDGERLSVAPSRLLVAALAISGHAEVAECAGLAGPVTVLAA
jgi:hypothetical protein